MNGNHFTHSRARDRDRDREGAREEEEDEYERKKMERKLRDKETAYQEVSLIGLLTDPVVQLTRASDRPTEQSMHIPSCSLK